ncbi:subclass B3 metallo-beta-lactamase [Sphingomicrobium arenosum]|uniref:subclass B3 metallo-beta-lactamase n=1 Tax=Sphingomicrobium arenosum TaxID=2233861 RepID=UPI002240EEE5|nr:subclass B3 metallo-beta-lactamase [Sphingomicrobium arenosum]
MSAKRIALLATLPTLLAGCTIESVSGNMADERPRFFKPAAFADACETWDEWDAPAPPVHVYGNTYLVGTCGISSVLVTSPEGYLLIDGGTEAGADLIAANIEQLGFSLRHVYWLTHSHEHFDHVAGLARLKELTQAQMVASAAAAPLLQRGIVGEDDPQFGMHDPHPPVMVDTVIDDGESLRLGDTLLTAFHTPGHSPGALSWTWEDCGERGCLTIAYVDSLSPVSHDDYKFTGDPAYLAAFRASLDAVEALDCDILLTPHPSASNMVRRFAAGNIIEPGACREYARGLRDRLDARIAEETGEMIDNRTMGEGVEVDSL